MDALQADIDTLEQEKLELKERLSVLSKKTLLEGLSRQAGQGKWRFSGLFLNPGFWGWLSIESQPQNAELRR